MPEDRLAKAQVGFILLFIKLSRSCARYLPENPAEGEYELRTLDSIFYAIYLWAMAINHSNLLSPLRFLFILLI